MKKQLLVILLVSFCGIAIAQQSARKEKEIVPPPPAEYQLDFTSEKKAPEYNGGRVAMYRFIYENMKYPQDAKEKGIEGDVLLKFTIGKDGSVSNVEVVEGTYPSIDAEAVRMVEAMPNWIPGKYGDQNIVSSTSLIIGFHLTHKQ